MMEMTKNSGSFPRIFEIGYPLGLVVCELWTDFWPQKKMKMLEINSNPVQNVSQVEWKISYVVRSPPRATELYH